MKIKKHFYLDVAQVGRAGGLGPSGRRFEPSHPDQYGGLMLMGDADSYKFRVEVQFLHPLPYFCFMHPWCNGSALSP